jgi:hypothetical protein
MTNIKKHVGLTGCFPGRSIIMSIIQDIIIGEIAGKNAAIHAYDKILWTIRTGYLTLFYSGWAIVLKAVIDNGGNFDGHVDVIILMLAITFGLTTGAYIVDKNYLKRKFRVIYALNSIMEGLINANAIDDIDNEILSKLNDHLRVSGDADNDRYNTDGYKQAVSAENAIFSISSLSLLSALAYIYIL